MSTVLLNGHPTWAVLPKKGGIPVVLLHGGLSSSASLLHAIGPRLVKHYRVAAFDRRGHGHTADTDEPFHYETMADEVIAFLELIGRPCHLIGHSDGGNVALFVAMKRPDLVRRMVLVGANYHYDGLMDLDHMIEGSEDYLNWATKFAAVSPDGIGRAHIVFRKTELLQATEPTLTPGDLATITVPTLVFAGDDDVATLAHTASLYESIPGAQLAIIPGTSHGVLKERTKLSVRIIRSFLDADLPPETRQPVRRRPPRDA